MIVTITGLPGNGKTLYALNYVKAWAEREGRQVYYHGINDLKLPWLVLDTAPELLDGPKNAATDVPQWWKVPARSIVVIDEAQKCGFGVRPRGVVPEWAKMLETHRHLGIDLVFITQDPSLIDSHDRRLSELHFHVVRTFGMQRATIHEFRPVRDTVSKSRKGSIEHRWKFPKASYEWYHSAEAHTHKARIPMRVIVLLLLPVLIGGLAWFAWAKFLNPHRERPGITAPSQSGQPGAPAQGNRPVQKLTNAEYVAQFAPRVPGLAYTAPAYDEVTKPTQAPYPAACVRMGKRCGCYTQQGTRLETTQQLCEGIVDGGFFVAWDRPLERAVAIRTGAPAAVPLSGGWASLGGVRAPSAQDIQPPAGADADGVMASRRRGKVGDQ